MFYRKRKAKYEARILKLENQKNQLKKKIRTLVLEPEGMKATLIKSSVLLEVNMEKCFWQGDSSSETSEGFYGRIQKGGTNKVTK